MLIANPIVNPGNNIAIDLRSIAYTCLRPFLLAEVNKSGFSLYVLSRASSKTFIELYADFRGTTITEGGPRVTALILT